MALDQRTRQRAALMVAVVGFAGLLLLLDGRRDRLAAATANTVKVECEVEAHTAKRTVDLVFDRQGTKVRSTAVTLEPGQAGFNLLVDLTPGPYTVRAYWLQATGRTSTVHADFAVPGGPVVLKLRDTP